MTVAMMMVMMMKAITMKLIIYLVMMMMTTPGEFASSNKHLDTTKFSHRGGLESKLGAGSNIFL